VWYEQFLQISRLYRALILLGLALAEFLCIFSLHDAICMYIQHFLVHYLPITELSMVRLALDLVD